MRQAEEDGKNEEGSIQGDQEIRWEERGGIKRMDDGCRDEKE